MISVEYISRMRQTLLDFHEQSGRFVQSNGCIPAEGSQARIEQANYPRPDSIVSAYCIGNQLIEFGAEHLTAFVKTISEPVETIACWTCVRSMLEACALSAWLQDPTIDPHTRVGRVFSLRYESMIQQLKFGRAINKPPDEIKKAEDRIEEVEMHALALGFSRVLTKGANPKRNGIGMIFPDATTMIKMMLHEEDNYRLLSGVAHGLVWAITELSFTPVINADVDIGGVLAKPFQKTADLKGFALLGITVFKAMAHPLWNQCRYYAWSSLQLEELFEDVADKLDMRNERRFWRSP